MMDKIAYCLLYISLIILRWNAISYIYQLFVFSSLVNYLFLSFLGCLAFFFMGLWDSFVYSGLRKARPLERDFLHLNLVLTTY